MKKILSIVLVLCMLGMGCVSMISCGNFVGELVPEVLQENEKQVEALSQGADKALTEFFDVAGVKNTLGGMKKGAVTVIVDNEMLSEEIGIGKINETLYFDFSNNVVNAIVSDTEVEYGEDTLGATLYLDGKTITAVSDALFGSNQAYKITVSDFANLENGALGSIVSDEMLSSAALATLRDVWQMLLPSEANDSFYVELAGWGVNLFDCFRPSVVAEKLDGRDVVTITYTLNNETVANFLVACYKDFPGTVFEQMVAILDGLSEQLPEINVEEILAFLEEKTDELPARLNEAMTLDLAARFSLTKESGTLMASEIAGTVEMKQGETPSVIAVDAKFLTSSNEISLDVSADITVKSPLAYVEDMKYGYAVSGKLTKTENNDGVTIIGDVDASSFVMYYGQQKETKMNDLFGLNVTYSKNGALSVNAAIGMNDARTEAALTGNLSIDGGKVTLEVDSVTAKGIVLNDLGITVILDPNASIPEAPSDATELLTMNEAAWISLMDKVQNSKLGKLFFASQKPEHDFNDGAINLPNNELPIGFLSGTYKSEYGDTFTFGALGSYEYKDAGNSISGFYVVDLVNGTLLLEFETDGDVSVEQYQIEKGEGVLVIDGVAYYLE